ncbi:hypothetical protein AX15_005223 [Amanita polypyramis BW_CC]|nr:hypothetical protein AX15_005223 [Amanita polypyramis BW_CC]
MSDNVHVRVGDWYPEVIRNCHLAQQFTYCPPLGANHASVGMCDISMYIDTPVHEFVSQFHPQRGG